MEEIRLTSVQSDQHAVLAPNPDSKVVLGPADTSHTQAGASGDDALSGMEDNDALYGDEGNDMLFGGLGDGRLFGGDGNDFLGGGQNRFYGGAGHDIMAYHAGGVIGGGSGIDTLLVDMATADPTTLDNLLSTAKGTEIAIGGNGVVEHIHNLTELADIGIILNGDKVDINMADDNSRWQYKGSDGNGHAHFEGGGNANAGLVASVDENSLDAATQAIIQAQG
jgi:Ca2+-binding RTX toxin-like protein